MAPRGKRGTTGAVQSHADLTCWVCGGEADVDDSPWLCLCTTEERRVHKACATQRLHALATPREVAVDLPRRAKTPPPVDGPTIGERSEEFLRELEESLEAPPDDGLSAD